MRFSTMMIPFLTVAPALAATTCTNAITPTRQDIVDAANTYYDVSQAAGCDWLGELNKLPWIFTLSAAYLNGNGIDIAILLACVSSLAGETAACAAAAVELGASMIPKYAISI